ncbi:unnamed protein product [Clonostachys rosea]|uniref:Tetratricopeptide repeat protein n=1 Tax=Bionectria ochroleuca TaxID=29856 RepID=A0ABY6V0X5_BIOOC|nr:unnamed protein product [Clonostachys rosea]
MPSNDNLALEVELSQHQIVLARGEPEKAIEMVREVLYRIERHNGPDHRWALNARLSIGRILGLQGNHAHARRCFELCRQHAHALFGNSPGDIDIDLFIGHTYAAEKKWDQAEAIFNECDRQTINARGYEVVRERVIGTLLEMRVERGQYLLALSHIAVLKSFPFLFFFRTHRVQTLVTLAALVLLVNALVLRQLMTILALGMIAMATLWWL